MALSLTVLLISNDLPSTDALRVLLSKHGHAVVAMMNAPKMAAIFDPDVAIVDIGSPLDGYNAAQRLRTAGLECRVIIVSADGQPDPHRCEQLGIQAHIVNPLEIEDLLRAVEAPAGLAIRQEQAEPASRRRTLGIVVI